MKVTVKRKFVFGLLLIFAINTSLSQQEVTMLTELSNAITLTDSIITARKFGFKIKYNSGGYYYKNKKSYLKNINGDLFLCFPFSKDHYNQLKKELDLSFLIWNIAPEKQLIDSEIQYVFSNEYLLSLFLDNYGRKKYIFVVLVKG